MLTFDNVLRQRGNKPFVGVGKIGVIGERKSALLACCVAAVASLGASAAQAELAEIKHPASARLLTISLILILKPLSKL